MPHIAYDPKDNCIWGTGDTVDEAVADASRWIFDRFGRPNYTKLKDGCPVVFSFMDDLVPMTLLVYPATKQLAEKVKELGNILFFINLDGEADVRYP